MFPWRTFFCTCCLALLMPARKSMAQYAVGSAGGTWEGIWGVGVQPACILLNPDKAEINFVRVSTDLDNSYLYLAPDGFGLFGFSRRLQVDTTVLDLGQLQFSEDRSVHLDARVQVPSFSLRLGARSALAFSNQARAAINALDLDALARKFGLDTIQLDPGTSRRVDEASLTAAGLSWTEHALTLAHSFKISDRSDLHAGLTGKYLLGMFGIQVTNSAPLLSALSDSLQTITDVQLTYAMALPAEEATGTILNRMIQGQGAGADIGVVYELRRKQHGEAIPKPGSYRLRLGVSVTDLGRITFKRAPRHSIVNGSTDLDALDRFRVNSIQELDTALSALLLNDGTASRSGTGLAIGLPTALHTSADYSPVPGFGIRAEVVLNLADNYRGPVVREQFHIAPRFETRAVSVALPVSMDTFNNWSMGLMVRAAGFMIGSDRLGALFGINEVRGADLYFGAKVRIGAKKEKTRSTPDGTRTHQPADTTKPL